MPTTSDADKACERPPPPWPPGTNVRIIRSLGPVRLRTHCRVIRRNKT